eukprot:CAMPEP_0176492108 /NCGR_PEP_ID=MMETSP0200_2-20121128/8797_1 /TAXON_ID=947934 /ORGANISM="Chaetoceros sp., Strain GSL56" /LENGTH=259 /DNA_ID=CAMNT_0017889597 /DNA_START=26 /DNA_END=802 /DNA_ORIENTATION=+
MPLQKFIVHPNHFYCKGMEYTGRSPDSPINKKNMERYRAHFGTSPGVCALLWNEISTIVPRKYCFKHILWGLMFLKVYATESVLAGKIGVDEDTFRDHMWVVIKAIASCKLRVIKFEKRLEKRNGSMCNLTVDGTDFRIQQMVPFWKGWFSHKFKGPGLRYEVGLNIQTGCICWINGPFAPGVWNDLQIFRLTLKTRLPPGEKVEADDGYRGDERVSTPMDAQNMHESLMKDNARGRHETVNRRFKQFNCLSQVFRHEI